MQFKLILFIKEWESRTGKLRDHFFLLTVEKKLKDEYFSVRLIINTYSMKTCVLLHFDHKVSSSLKF